MSEVAWTARLRQSAFIRHNAIFFCGSLLTGFFNYLYYPVLGRLMGPVQFGETQALVSLFLQIVTFLTVLGLLAINIVVNHNDAKAGNRVVIELEKLALFISILLLVLSLIFGSVLREYFKFGSATPFAMLMLAVITSVPWTFRSAYLRAKHYFGLYSVANASSSAFKLLASAIFVIIGFSTSGAIFGLALSQVFASVYVIYYARRQGFQETLFRHADGRRQSHVPDLQLIRPELNYAILVLIGSLAITILYSMDILVVKHYFDAHTAGLYASIATVSRILFFLTGSVAGVMMPAIKLRGSPKQNLSILFKSFLLVMVIGGGTLVVFWLVPRLVVNLLMGRTYLPYASLLPRLGLAIFIISIANLFLTYYMALRRYEAGVIAIVGTVITYLLLLSYHQSLLAVVNSLLAGGTILVILLGGWLLWNNRQVLRTEV